MLRRIFFLCLYLYSFLYMMSTHISRTVERCVVCYLMLSESRSQKVCSVQCSMVYNSGDLTTGELWSTGICQWLHEYRALWYDLAHFLLIVSFPTIALNTIFPYHHIFPWKRALALVLDLRVDSLVSTFLKTSSLKQVPCKAWTVWQFLWWWFKGLTPVVLLQVRKSGLKSQYRSSLQLSQFLLTGFPTPSPFPALETLLSRVTIYQILRSQNLEREFQQRRVPLISH